MNNNDEVRCEYSNLLVTQCAHCRTPEKPKGAVVTNNIRHRLAVLFQENPDDAPTLKELAEKEFPELDTKVIYALIESLRYGKKTSRGLFSSGPEEPQVIACIRDGARFGYGIGTKASVGNYYLGNARLKQERARAVNDLVLAEKQLGEYPDDPKARMLVRRAQNHLDEIDETVQRIAERDELDKAHEALLERETALNLEMALERREREED